MSEQHESQDTSLWTIGDFRRASYQRLLDYDVWVESSFEQSPLGQTLGEFLSDFKGLNGERIVTIVESDGFESPIENAEYSDKERRIYLITNPCIDLDAKP